MRLILVVIIDWRSRSRRSAHRRHTDRLHDCVNTTRLPVGLCASSTYTLDAPHAARRRCVCASNSAKRLYLIGGVVILLTINPPEKDFNPPEKDFNFFHIAVKRLGFKHANRGASNAPFLRLYVVLYHNPLHHKKRYKRDFTRLLPPLAPLPRQPPTNGNTPQPP